MGIDVFEIAHRIECVFKIPVNDDDFIFFDTADNLYQFVWHKLQSDVRTHPSVALETKPTKKFIGRLAGSGGKHAWRHNRWLYWYDVNETQVHNTASILNADEVWGSLRDILVDVLRVRREDVRPEFPVSGGPRNVVASQSGARNV
jgi:hypothetical protein